VVPTGTTTTTTGEPPATTPDFSNTDPNAWWNKPTEQYTAADWAGYNAYMNGGTSTNPTPTEPPVTQVDQQQVTNVAVIPIVDDADNFTGVSMILEKAGDLYVGTFYDKATATLFSGTESPSDLYLLAATPEPDQLMDLVGTTGDLTVLQFTDANGQVVPTPQVNAGLPQAFAQLPGPQPGVLQPPVMDPGPAAVMRIPAFLQQPQPQPLGTIIVQQPVIVGQPQPQPFAIVMPNRFFPPARPGLFPVIRSAIFPQPAQPWVRIGNYGVWIPR